MSNNLYSGALALTIVFSISGNILHAKCSNGIREEQVGAIFSPKNGEAKKELFIEIKEHGTFSFSSKNKKGADNFYTLSPSCRSGLKIKGIKALAVGCEVTFYKSNSKVACVCSLTGCKDAIKNEEKDTCGAAKKTTMPRGPGGIKDPKNFKVTQEQRRRAKDRTDL